MRLIFVSLLLSAALVGAPSLSRADDDALVAKPTPLLDFGGRGVEERLDDDVLDPKPTPDLNVGGRSTDGQVGSSQQSEKPHDPLGMSPVIEAILGG